MASKVRQLVDDAFTLGADPADSGDLRFRKQLLADGTPDMIQITRTTRELLGDDFVTEPLGLVDVKGKGQVETWRLVGRAG